MISNLLPGELADFLQQTLAAFLRVPWIWLSMMSLIPAFLLSVLLVYNTILAARHFDILARPSERGSHAQPTPRLGGLGAGFSFYLWFLLTLIFVLLRLKPSLGFGPWLATSLVGGTWALIGGLLDDVLEMPPRWKFLFQAAAAGSAVALGFAPGAFYVPGLGAVLLPPVAAALLAFVFIIFWMNAYNFMDGMDGQACLFAIIVFGGFTIPLAIYNLSGNLTEITLLLTLIGTLFGLLWHNHPGRSPESKTFMGDSGSHFYGFLLAVMTLRLAQPGVTAGASYPFGAALIALSPFAWDVLYTLGRRTLRGENVLQAHRSHLYQRLLVAGWSHGRTLLFNACFWAAAVLLSWVYTVALISNMTGLTAWSIGATVGLLLAYTAIVLLVEARAPVRRTSAVPGK